MPLRIYLVEDNQIIRENLAATLVELADAQIVGFAIGETEAIEWLAAHPDKWDIVVVDIFLKQGNGLAVVAFGRARASHQRLVVLTNFASAGVRDRCLVLGADAVFDKSNEIEALIAYCSVNRSQIGS